LLIGIREINNDIPIDELTLLLGNEILNDEKNIQFCLQVLKFIQDTGRFLIDFLVMHSFFFPLV
jgi:hypothetical protein